MPQRRRGDGVNIRRRELKRELIRRWFTCLGSRAAKKPGAGRQGRPCVVDAAGATAATALLPRRPTASQASDIRSWHFLRPRAMSAVRSLSVEKRTSRGNDENDAIDPKETLRAERRLGCAVHAGRPWPSSVGMHLTLIRRSQARALASWRGCSSAASLSGSLGNDRLRCIGPASRTMLGTATQGE
jgi:hypothetical protein